MEILNSAKSSDHARSNTTTYHCPFFLTYDPTERLLSLNIHSDPDVIYTAFEPQCFNEQSNGKGIIIVAYRKDDGKMDIYHSPSLSIHHKTFDIVGNGLTDMKARPEHDEAVFESHPDKGVQMDIHFQFQDKQDRLIVLQVNEENVADQEDNKGMSCFPRLKSPRRTPFSVLTPLGSSTSHPSSLPLVFLYGFKLVRKSSETTSVTIDVNGRKHTLDDLSILVDRCPPLAKTVHEFETAVPAGDPLDGGQVVAAMKSISLFNEKRTLQMTFHPPFPDIQHVIQQKEKKKRAFFGRFTVKADRSRSHVTGTYSIRPSEDEAQIQLVPKWYIWLTYLAVSSFRRWPKTYIWNAKVIIKDPQIVQMKQSEWHRTETPRGFHYTGHRSTRMGKSSVTLTLSHPTDR